MGAHLFGMDDSDVARITAQVGTLTVTVWPDTPVGEHQRYAYRIEDTSSGQAIQGRDLFTGAGAPVEPGQALRELAGFLTAASEARQYALDNPGAHPENEGLFPAWTAEAARRNSSALAVLTEFEQEPPAAEQPAQTKAGPRWISVVFLQGEEADEVLDLIDRDGAQAAITHLAGYDFGQETIQAALENGYVYDTPPTGTLDRTTTDGQYTLTYNPFLGHVGLLREYDFPPDPDLHGIIAAQTPPSSATAPSRGASRDRGRTADTARWFARPAGRPPSTGQGVSL